MCYVDETEENKEEYYVDEHGRLLEVYLDKMTDKILPVEHQMTYDELIELINTQTSCPDKLINDGLNDMVKKWYPKRTYSSVECIDILLAKTSLNPWFYRDYIFFIFDKYNEDIAK